MVNLNLNLLKFLVLFNSGFSKGLSSFSPVLKSILVKFSSSHSFIPVLVQVTNDPKGTKNELLQEDSTRFKRYYHCFCWYLQKLLIYRCTRKVKIALTWGSCEPGSRTAICLRFACLLGELTVLSRAPGHTSVTVQTLTCTGTKHRCGFEIVFKNNCCRECAIEGNSKC